MITLYCIAAINFIGLLFVAGILFLRSKPAPEFDLLDPEDLKDGPKPPIFFEMEEAKIRKLNAESELIEAQAKALRDENAIWDNHESPPANT